MVEIAYDKIHIVIYLHSTYYMSKFSFLYPPYWYFSLYIDFKEEFLYSIEQFHEIVMQRKKLTAIYFCNFCTIIFFMDTVIFSSFCELDQDFPFISKVHLIVNFKTIIINLKEYRITFLNSKYSESISLLNQNFGIAL